MSEQMNIPEFTDADKRETTFHNFVDKPEVVGKLKAISQGSYGDQYVIDTPDGDITIGTYDVLKSQIHQGDVGKWIKVVCKGDIKSPKTGRNYKNFEVFVK